MTRGQANEEDLAMLEELSGLLRETSLCGLWQNGAEPRHEHAAFIARSSTKRTLTSAAQCCRPAMQIAALMLSFRSFPQPEFGRVVTWLLIS
jgi:hypothetical protein